MDPQKELRRKSKQKSKDESFKKEKVTFGTAKVPPEALSRVYSFSNRVTVNLDESYFGRMMDAENRLHGTAECMGGHNLEKARCGSFFQRLMNKMLFVNRKKKNPRCSDNPERGTRIQERIVNKKKRWRRKKGTERERKKKRSHKRKDDGGGGGNDDSDGDDEDDDDDDVTVTIYQALSVCQALSSGLYKLYETDQYVRVLKQKTDSKQAAAGHI